MHAISNTTVARESGVVLTMLLDKGLDLLSAEGDSEGRLDLVRVLGGDLSGVGGDQVQHLLAVAVHNFVIPKVVST